MSDHAIELDQNIVHELLDAMTVLNCDSKLTELIRSTLDS